MAPISTESYRLPMLAQKKFSPDATPLRLPAGWYAQQMAWTCQKEWQWEKTTRIPLRLRLGSKEQVDWLEGKGR